MARQALKTATKKSTSRSAGAAVRKTTVSKKTSEARATTRGAKSTKSGAAAKGAAASKTTAKAGAAAKAKKPSKASAAPSTAAKGTKAAKPAKSSKTAIKTTDVVAKKRGAGAKPAAGGDNPLKQRFAALQVATRQITTMKRSISKHFFDVGVILNEIRDTRLYEVKGYGSFESFVEREIDLNKVICLRSARIAQALDRDVAIEAGLDRAAAAVAALDGEFVQASVAATSSSAGPLVPLHKQ